jgi:hypothetical protein
LDQNQNNQNQINWLEEIRRQQTDKDNLRDMIKALSYNVNNIHIENGNNLDKLENIDSYQIEGHDNRVAKEILFLRYKNIGRRLNGLTTLNLVRGECTYTLQIVQ